MTTDLVEHLHGLLDDATANLPGVSKKRMFASWGWFAKEKVFAIAWRSGRIIFKLPQDAAADELSAMPGAEQWTMKAGKPMRYWVLAPESFHDDAEALQRWTKIAHSLAGQEPPKAAKKSAPRKAAPAKRGAAKAASAKRAAPAKKPPPRRTAAKQRARPAR